VSLLLLVPAASWMAPAVVEGQSSNVSMARAEEAVLGGAPIAQQVLAVDVRVPVPEYDLRATAGGHEIVMEGFGRLLVPGKPILPSKIVAVAIPPGAEAVEVVANLVDEVTLPGTYEIAPAPLVRVIGQEDSAIYGKRLQRYESNRASVYGSDDPYPAHVVEFVRSGGYRRYNLVDVRVTPFTYHPRSGRLAHYPDITVRVRYTLPTKADAGVADAPTRTERVARDLILNYGQARSWCPQALRTSTALHDFVIITLDTLESSVLSLADWESQKGRSVDIVTTSWIDTNYSGVDLAQKIRNFLRDKYPSSEWGIEDVLLVGHQDDVPMRRTAQDVGYGRPETDFYYAELSLPDDQSWDIDRDREYGEDSDPVDFYPEVNVGRIPWSDPATVASICQKSIAYEQNTDPAFKRNILLLGAYFWENTDTAKLMEAKAAQPWMADWTMTRMYEQNADFYSPYPCDYPLLRSNVVSVWGSGKFCFVNYAGHGSYRSSHILGLNAPAFIDMADCPLLNDQYPSIIFADACSNNETDYDSIGRAMLKQGGVGFLGATKVAYGAAEWDEPSDGSTQSLDYFFTSHVTSGDFTMGQAHQQALRDMYTYGLWSNPKYETFEWGAILGNPDIGIRSEWALSVMLPDGPPRYATPDAPTYFSVQIRGGTESYVPGSGLLHYRLGDGTFETSALAHDAGDLYEATLPPGGGAGTIEFYVSAEGDGGTTVSSPYNAPEAIYTAAVGSVLEVFREGFDVDPGWTTEGQWAFGRPTGGGGEYGGPDPTSGHTGDNVYGYNLDGDYPNNLPEQHLTSLPIDCSGVGGLTLKFWRWLGVEQGIYDRAYVRVSNNGSDWTTVWENGAEVTDYAWAFHELDISAVADGQPTVYLRWTMGPTDRGWRYCGWNIDDVEISGFATCVDGILNQGEERIDCGGPCAACECASDSTCADGLFCSGEETCDALGQCQAGPVPCPPALCEEDGDTCIPCENDEQCNDGQYCNGAETCDGYGACRAGTPVDCSDGLDCTTDACNETSDSCENTANDALCDDGNICTIDWCEADYGCRSDGTGVGNPCNDGDDCTGGDVCQGDPAGTCLGEIAEAPMTGPDHVVKNRYLSIVPNNPGRQTAMYVRLASSTTFPEAVGKWWWVGEPREVCENAGQGPRVPPWTCGSVPGTPKPTMWSSELACSPVCLDWHSLTDVAGNPLDVLHVGDPDVVTDSMYEIWAVDCACNMSDGGNYAGPTAWSTSKWGDTTHVPPSDCPRPSPNGTIDLILDCVGILDRFMNQPCAILKSRADIAPGDPNRIIDIMDAVWCVDAFRGGDYPYPAPAGCP